jgi:hypothetical protein
MMADFGLAIADFAIADWRLRLSIADFQIADCGL